MFTINLNDRVIEPLRISMNDICWHNGRTGFSIFDWENVYTKNRLYEAFLGTGKGEWWGSLRYWPVFPDDIIGGKPINPRTAFISMAQGKWHKAEGGYAYKGHIYDEYWSSSLMFPTMIGGFDGFVIKPSSAKFNQEFIWLETNQVSDLLAENSPNEVGNQIVILRDSKDNIFDAFFSYLADEKFVDAWNKKRKEVIALIDKDKEIFEKVCREDELLRDERKRRKEVTEEIIRRRMKIELETFKNPPEFCLDSRIEAAVHEAGFEMPSCW